MRVSAHPRFFESLVDVNPVVYPNSLVPLGTLQPGALFTVPDSKSKTFRGDTYYTYEPTQEIIGYKLIRGGYYSIKEVEASLFLTNEAEKFPVYGKKEATKFRPHVYEKIAPKRRQNYGFELNVRLHGKNNSRGTHSGYLSENTLVQPVISKSAKQPYSYNFDA